MVLSLTELNNMYPWLFPFTIDMTQRDPLALRPYHVIYGQPHLVHKSVIGREITLMDITIHWNCLLANLPNLLNFEKLCNLRVNLQKLEANLWNLLILLIDVLVCEAFSRPLWMRDGRCPKRGIIYQIFSWIPVSCTQRRVFLVFLKDPEYEVFHLKVPIIVS